MTKTLKSRRHRPFRDSQQIHIPHSSWARRERPSGAAALVAPEYFWQRLGL